MTNEIYILENLADKLGIAPRTLREEVTQGRLKGKKIWGRWYVLHSDIVDFISNYEKPKNDKE